tara:strand:+ start:157 stop:1374 length:1218 start_codon:yes stop_codon:yes gene_type:complete
MRKKKCRNCKTLNVEKVFELGKFKFTGKFPKKNEKIESGVLGLDFCQKCNLVQLSNSFNQRSLFSKDYGYKTGLNQTMTNHMRSIHDIIVKKVPMSKNDQILDIACNDGTLLNMYNKKFKTFGIDPVSAKYKSNFKNINHIIFDFFSSKKIKNFTKKKFKIITALSVFYDLDDPNKFLKDIYEILDNEGICLIEHADLLSIIQKNMFDTICHEHVAYYSTRIMQQIALKNNLKLIDVVHNDVNGGSMQYFLTKRSSKLKINVSRIRRFLDKEKKYRLHKIYSIKAFFERINVIKENLKNYLINENSKKRKIYVYGASTKGNVLLQYFGLNNKIISAAVERNPQKFGRYTPGSKIPIISETKARKNPPDMFLVLPWHFKKEILNREKALIRKGVNFLFPLPKLEIY